MTAELVYQAAEQFDEAFFIIGGLILLIEFVEMLVKGTLRTKTVLEMIASASTQLPYLLVETLILASAYGFFYVLHFSVVPFQIPITWWSIALIILLADLTYYWEHRVAHEVRLLWTQHAVHHSSRDMNIVTGVRFGPFEGVWSVIAHLPLVFVGFPPELVFTGIIVVLAYQTWLHTELIGKLGPLEWILNTPSHHRVHHGSDEKYLDKNFGGILIIWDRWFGTFQIEEETPRYGLKRDFDSQNPLLVWFSEIPGLARDVWHAQSFGEAWRLMMNPPGWRPEDK